MHVYINDEKFTEEPLTCGSCPFFSNGRSAMSLIASARGHCRLFDEMHNSYINPPRRCLKLFKKAFTYPDGTHLVITVKMKDNKKEHGNRQATDNRHPWTV